MNTARELSDRLASLYRNERNATADFLIALAAFDERMAWREIGYPSLWAFLRHELKLSKSAAFQRKTAAELVQAYPAVGDALRSGELCLSTVAELGRVLTPENAEQVLPRFFGLSYREAEALSASLRPAEVIPTRDVVRLLPSTPTGAASPALPASPPAISLPQAPAPAPELAIAVPASEPAPSTQAPSRPAREPSTAYLDADRARISMTVPRRVLDKLEAARDALAHVLPDGNLADILEHALDLVLVESRKKRALVDKPRSGSKVPRDGSRHVPAKIARAVWKRSGGRCECILPNGDRCEVTRALEIDHIRPFALGGEPTEQNLRIACRDCNQLAARRAFGDMVMDRYGRGKERVRSARASHRSAARPVASLADPPAPPPLQHGLSLVTGGSAR